MATTIKLQDTSPIIGSNSRLENYWKQNGFEKFYVRFRSGMKLPLTYQTVDSVDKLVKLFKLNAVGFGNWVTQEDRFNYISALTIALYDIDKVCRFKNNIGLNGTVSFSFGARGKGAALAHFEPNTFIVNVTRYIDNSNTDKERRFLLTGGAGSVAHEFGHALDYYFGTFRDKITGVPAISGGNTIRTRYDVGGGAIRLKMNKLIDAICWRTPYKESSQYYKRLEANFSGDYMFRRNEIFARAFEKYIQVKLRKLGIVNKFLNETKYAADSYLTDAEIQKVIPLFDDLMAEMRSRL